MIVISDYREDWPDRFGEIGSALRSALADRAERIDHIGSTAVPGLAAKDIIDVQVTVSDLDTEGLAEAMVAVGAVEVFRGQGDHVPPGVVIGPDDLEKWLWRRRDGVDANFHIRVAGRWNQRYALLCRDFLRSHPETAAAYGEVKRQLARLFGDDVDSYYAVKDPAIDLFMSAAGEWAEWSGWRPGPSDA